MAHNIGKNSTIAILYLLLALLACQEESVSSPPQVQYSDFQEALMLGELHGLANGGAYLVSVGGIYHIQGGVAEKVSGLPEGMAGYGEITALADGTALYLARLNDPPQLFWLRGSASSLVCEGTIGARIPRSASPPDFFFAENQRLRRKLEEAEDLAVAPEEPFYDEPYFENVP